MKSAGELTVSQLNPSPDAWRADANKERITFLPGVLGRSARWTNRPTFQQVLNFTSHRPRPSQRRSRARQRVPALTGSLPRE